MRAELPKAPAAGKPCSGTGLVRILEKHISVKRYSIFYVYTINGIFRGIFSVCYDLLCGGDLLIKAI